MKKQILTISLLFMIAAVCFAQYEAKNFEGYDNLPWETTVENFLKQNPSAYEKTGEDDKIRNERLFYKKGNSITRVYRFFNNKLYWGRTVYENPSGAITAAIAEKLKNEYGNITDYQKGNKKDGEYAIYIWSVTANLTVRLECTTTYDSYGHISAELLFITYQNDKIMSERKNYEKQQLLKNLEL